MRRTARSLIACGLLLGLVGGREAEGKVFSPTVFTLQNGLQVVVVEDHLSPVVTQMVWYKTGSADEVQGHSGLAHFLEHLMFKGTPTVGPGELSKIVGRNGGSDNAFTTYDYTAYFQNIRAERLELVMKLESDRMRNLSLTDDQVYPERDVIIEERRQTTDSSPEARLSEALRSAFYVNSPYGRPIIGWLHEMQQLTTAEATAWYKKWYAPNNAILIVAGDVQPDAVKALAEKYYGPIPAQQIPARVRPQMAPLSGADRKITLRDPDVHQPTFMQLFAAPNYSAKTRKDALALEVFGEIFGGGETSRLYQALVVKAKVATSAGSFYDDAAVDPVDFGIFGNPGPGKDIAEVEKSVRAEIRRVAKDGVTEAEVSDAKTRLQAAAILARDSLEGPAMSFGQSLATGQTIDDVENWPDNIGAVTAADVNAAVKILFAPDNASATGWLLPPEGTKAPMDAAAMGNTPPLGGGSIR